MSDDPQRLLDQPTTNRSLRSALAEARKESPDVAVRARLAASIGLPRGPVPVSLAPRRRVLKAILGVALVVAGASALRASREAPPVSPPAPPLARPSEPTVRAPVAVDATPTEPSVSAPAVSAPEAPEAPPRTPRSAQPVASAPLRAQPSEAQLLADARTALRRQNTERARALLDEHAKRFPNGTFVQEREVLRIDLLLAEGSSTAARDAASRFLERWPESAHAPRLRTIAVPP